MSNIVAFLIITHVGADMWQNNWGQIKIQCDVRSRITALWPTQPILRGCGSLLPFSTQCFSESQIVLEISRWYYWYERNASMSEGMSRTVAVQTPQCDRLIIIHINLYHRLRGSKVNGKMEILTPCKWNPENIETKLGMNDYILNPYNIANFCGNQSKGVCSPYCWNITPVSYTHLTLPTNREV